MPINPVLIGDTVDGSGTETSSPYLTVLSYGHTRSGKTRFAATWPNAVVIADATERGWDTIVHMPAEDFYHPGQRPLVLPVSDQQEMSEALVAVEDWVARGLVDTVVIDSITFYAESWISAMQARARAANVKLEGWDIYAPLLEHLTALRKRVHGWRCNVVWLALAKDPGVRESGGPMLPGSSRSRFPPACNYVFYHRVYDADAEGVDGKREKWRVYEAHNASYEGYIGGGRDNGKLGDSIHYPTYRLIAEKLSLPPFPPKVIPRDVVTAAFPGPNAQSSSSASSPARAAAAPRPVVRRVTAR